MHRSSHYIKTQSLSFHCNKQELGTELYEHSSSFFYEQLMPKFEHLFDSLVPQDQYINIDRLEIEISIDERNWNSGSCCQLILEEISSRLKQDIGSGQRIEHFKTLEERKEEKDFKWEGALKIYLQDGYLPWNMDSIVLKSQLKSLNESSLIALLSTNWLKEIVFRSSFALKRLLQLIELEKLSELKGNFAIRKRNWKVFEDHFFHAFENIYTKEIPPQKWSMWEFSYLLGREASDLFPELIDELSLRKDKQFWHELANLEESSSPLARNLARDWQDAITSCYKYSDNSG
ncbi:MAG: contractile injection system tape measure protein, partial [Bacteroidota bacterium]